MILLFCSSISGQEIEMDTLVEQMNAYEQKADSSMWADTTFWKNMKLYFEIEIGDTL